MKTNKISVPEILDVSYGALERLGDTLIQNNIKKVHLFLGVGIKKLFGSQVELLMNHSELQVIEVHEYEELNIEKLVNKAFSLVKKEEGIIGIGGGKVVDTAKYIAFLRDVPFISVPTSISNDGFASSGVSLKVAGKRKSVKAAMPYGVIADLTLLKSAPERLYFSGLGDIVSKISAIYDWEHEEKLGHTQVDHFASLIAKKSVNSVVRLPFKYINDDLFIKEAVDSLIMSGIAMEIAGSSAPASGGEHMLSHALDQLLENPYPHGIQVGIATYLMALVQEHRIERVRSFLKTTGFFDYVKTLNVPKAIWLEAIDLAPSIKPGRRTYLHDENYRIKAKHLLSSDPILDDILN